MAAHIDKSYGAGLEIATEFVLRLAEQIYPIGLQRGIEGKVFPPEQACGASPLYLLLFGANHENYSGFGLVLPFG
jgi:hypothetical protein